MSNGGRAGSATTQDGGEQKSSPWKTNAYTRCRQPSNRTSTNEQINSLHPFRFQFETIPLRDRKRPQFVCLRNEARSSAVAVIADRTAYDVRSILANYQIGFSYKFANDWYAHDPIQRWVPNTWFFWHNSCMLPSTGYASVRSEEGFQTEIVQSRQRERNVWDVMVYLVTSWLYFLVMGKWKTVKIGHCLNAHAVITTFDNKNHDNRSNSVWWGGSQWRSPTLL